MTTIQSLKCMQRLHISIMYMIPWFGYDEAMVLEGFTHPGVVTNY